jgi:hypothetical protein
MNDVTLKVNCLSGAPDSFDPSRIVLFAVLQ